MMDAEESALTQLQDEVSRLADERTHARAMIGALLVAWGVTFLALIIFILN